MQKFLDCCSCLKNSNMYPMSINILASASQNISINLFNCYVHTQWYLPVTFS